MTAKPYIQLSGEYSEESFSISGSYPGNDESGNNTPLSLSKIIKNIWGLTAPTFGDDVKIAEFSLTMEPRDRRFEFTANDVIIPITSDVSLTFREVLIQGEKPNGQFSGRMALSLDISERVALVFEVIRPPSATASTDITWLIEGGLDNERSTPTIHEFVTAFIGERWADNLPDTLRDITLTELYGKLEVTATTRSTMFRGGMEWRKASDIGALVISGAAELEVTTEGDVSTPKGVIEGTLNIDTENSLLENLNISAKATFELKDGNSESDIDEIEMTIGISEAFQITTTYDVNDKILSISFENEQPLRLTFGDMLTFIMKLADPYVESYRLDPPWDELNDTNLLGFLSDISLEFNFEKKTVALNIDYSDNPKSYFDALKVEKISLTAKQKAKPKGRRKYDVTIDFTGNFMGMSVGPGRGQQLSWNVQDDTPVSSPGKGASVFELYYLLIGQRVAFNDVHTLTTMTAIDRRMVDIVDTISTGEIGDGIVFSRESKWMIASHFMVMETVDAILIFNDPFLYGARVRLLGKRAGKFKGLIFEILYRRINENLGVYHTELTLPDAMRNMRMGKVKITLPTFILDIYTNGDFYFDAGFPHKGDFSRSAMVEYGYFTGWGGFYVGKFSGENTGGYVPAIINGAFDPIIIFGLGLKVTFARGFSKGPLSAEISVTFQGIFEGVLAWFKPDNPGLPTDTYYKIEASLQISGRLYGKVDFTVISVSVEVAITASAEAIIECYMPTVILVAATVSVSAELKILFITIEFEFEMTVSESFTIGEREPTPWIVAGGGGVREVQLLAGVTDAQHVSLNASDPDWNTDFEVWSGAVQGLDIIVQPDYTLGLVDDVVSQKGESDRSEIKGVALLFIENDPNRTESRDFSLLTQAIVAWMVYAAFQQDFAPTDSNHEFRTHAAFTSTQLRRVYNRLFKAPRHDDDYQAAAIFTPDQLLAFLQKNFMFNFATRDANDRDIKATIFPLFPEMSFTVDKGAMSEDATHEEKAELFADYFRLLGRTALEKLIEVMGEDSDAMTLDYIFSNHFDISNYAYIAGVVGRFLLHGQRVNDKPLYAQTGQQFSIEADERKYMLTLTGPDDADWIKLNGNGANTLTYQPTGNDLTRLNNIEVNWLFVVGETDEPTIDTPVELPYYALVNPRFALRDARGIVNRVVDGVHTLWKLPNGMQRLLHTVPADSSSEVTIHLPADFDTTGIMTHYGFVTRLDFKIRRIDGKAGPLPNTYRIVEVSAETRNRIERLMDASGDNPNRGLHFLVSDAFQSGICSILRTNLAAAGAPGQITNNTDMTVFGERVAPGSTNAQAVRNTLKTLWQAGNIGGEGFYLHYQDMSDKGLVDDIFDANGAAMVAVMVEDYGALEAKAAHTDLLCTVKSTSTTAPQSPRSLVAELLDVSLQQPTQTLDAGYVGFRILRKKAEVTSDPTDPELDVNFQLLTYRTLADDDGFFKDSGASIPTGPTRTTVQQNGNAVEKWLYERSFPTTPFVARLPLSSETVFPASENPYAGVGAHNAVQVDFDLIDIYGNHTRADAGLHVLPLPVRYTDNVIGLNQYPGLLESYKFASDGSLTYFMRLHAETFINTSQSPYAEWIDRISNAQDRYRRIYWQLVQEDLKLLLHCSINKGNWHDITAASKASFVQYATECYKFLDALHNCAVEVSEVGDTLGDLARTYRLSLEDLARPNQSSVGLFDAGKSFTVEYTISPKDSISYLRDTIGAADADIRSLPLSEGTITLGGIDYTVKDGDTLNSRGIDLSILSDNERNTKALFVAGTEMPNDYTIDADDTITYLRKSENATDADIVALPLKAGTVTLGGTDYTVKDGDTLASLEIELSAVSQNERDLQGLFQTGASLTLSHTTAEGDSIVSIQRTLQNRGITPLSLPVLLEGLKEIPLKREIKIVTHLRAGESEGFILLQSSPIKTSADWAVANQHLMGIVKTGTNIGVKTTANDTLYTLATALGISVAEAAQRVTAKKGWNENAKVVAVPQPFSGSVKMETHTDSLPDEFIFPLLTRITVRRDETLIAAQFSSDDFTNSTGAVNPVVEAYAYLAPHTGETTDGVSLAGFAQDFESAFAGVKLGTSKEKENQTVSADAENPATAKPLWGVRLGEGGVTYEIETGDKARFYSMPPLSTRLITDTVSIEGETKSYADVDIDDWAIQFLEAVDAFLEYAPPMYHADDLRAHVDTVLNAKETLASAISKRVTAIYNNQLQELADNPDRITAAQEAYRQQLMQTLRSAYDIETIVQLDATISEAEKLIPAAQSEKLAPRLFGQPTVKAENGQQSETAPKFTLSAAKIPLVEPNYLTFFYNTVEPGADELAEHDLVLKIDSLEFNIQPRADMDNMHDSVWLKFVIPLDEYDLKHFAIPIPLRDFPDSPALIYQKAGLDKDTISLDHIREWAYTFVYERGSEAQDSIQTRLDFTGAKVVNPPTATEKALFDELAKFLDIAEQNRTLFEKLEMFINQPDQLKNLNAPNNFETRIGTFATRVAAVANAWGNWTPPTGDYADRNPSYEIEELEAGDEIHVTLTSLEGAPTDNPLFQMTGYQREAKDDPNATYTHRFVPDPSDDTPDLGSSLLPDRKLTIDNLDIINHQRAQAEIWILRNDEFVEGKKTNPAFVYRTPIIEFSRALVPHLENSIKHNIAEIDSPSDPQTRKLDEHLKAMFEIIIPQEPQQPFGIQLEARYVYALVDLEGVEYDLTATLPAMLGTPLLDLDDDAGAEEYWNKLNLYLANFRAALRDWYVKREPATIGGRWVFTFSIYSGKGDSLPLLKIDYLYLLLEHISDL